LFERIELDQSLDLLQAGTPVALLKVLHGNPIKGVLEV
jgi:hypothetical protein